MEVGTVTNPIPASGGSGGGAEGAPKAGVQDLGRILEDRREGSGRSHGLPDALRQGAEQAPAPPDPGQRLHSGRERAVLKTGALREESDTHPSPAPSHAGSPTPTTRQESLVQTLKGLLAARTTRQLRNPLR